MTAISWGITALMVGAVVVVILALYLWEVGKDYEEEAPNLEVYDQDEEEPPALRLRKGDAPGENRPDPSD